MTGRNGSSKRKTWMILIGGTAVLLIAAGIMVQVMRPPSAFPDDAAGKATTGKAAGSDQTSQKKNAVARVDKEVITYEELAAECVRRYGEEILDNLINRKIIQQACDKAGVEVSEAEVTAEINKIAKKFGLDPNQWLQMLQAERKITPAQYRADIIWPMLALRKLAGEEIKVTKQDLQRAFIRNYGPRVKARAIVLDNPRRAGEVQKKVMDNPDDFERLAREHSIDPTSRALDGAVPPIRRFAGSEELETAAFKLKEGEISGVIQVGMNQYIILKCEGRTEPTVTDIAEVQDILMQELREEKVQESVAKVFERIKSEARVDNYVTGVTTGGEKKSAVAGKTPAKTPNGIQQTGAKGLPGKPAAGKTASRFPLE